ncbi:flagellar motor protein MotA [Methylocaldum marinum]|uniref:Flagellar motor protein MotA n=1 Tax=Methylocaldum marinum TaxID=1432792 RepID=A0A250KZ01_9GAMM|nr:hypothetical protein [Methylocaldum marinum]BBA36908.1 flagellar motor protein MotA [Methylocaldum marinum]
MGHPPGQRCLERSEEVIEQGLEAAFEGAEQEGDKDRKGEDALPGEGGWAGAMVGDELGIVKRFGEIGKNTGMDSAKRPSLINPLFSYSYVTL